MSPAARAKVPPLTDGNYSRFRDLILRRTGMFFGERRREALNRVVTEHAYRAEAVNLDIYYTRLDGTPTDHELWDDLIEALTVNETYFFRDPEQIEALRRHILPDLITRHEADHTLRLWSAGCSTGEEPYTLAILLRQLLPDIDRWKILILATDLNKPALHTASQATYRAWSFRQTDSGLRQAYFTPDGDRFVLAPCVQHMVTFAYLNLAENSYPSAATCTTGLDLILCRNVSIYLPGPVIREVAGRFYQSLAPGGWLMVGPSETDDAYYTQFETLKLAGAIVYQKVAARPLAAPARLLPAGTCPEPQADVFGSWRPLASIKPLPAESQPSDPGAPSPYERGLRLAAQHRFDEARQCFGDCLDQKPGYVDALYQLARLEANAGHLAAARQWAERTLEQDPLHCEAHFTLAQLHQEQGEPDQAIACYKKVLYLDPEFVLAHVSLANLYHNAGHDADAARHRAQAMRLAAKLLPETVLPGSDDLTAGHLVSTDGGL